VPSSTRLLELVAVAAIAVAGWVALSDRGERVDACSLLPPEVLRLAGVDANPHPFEPEGPGRSSGCHYGRRSPEPNITVFAVASGRDGYAAARDVVVGAGRAEEADGRDYRAFWTDGPRPGSAALSVLRGPTWVQVILYDVPDRSIRPRLAHAVAEAL
jgi:hypothetical protein